MRVATVTLNPAIDQTVRVDHFRLNTVNRGQRMQFDAGGKGVNVASFLADYGYPVAVTGFLGEENPEIFEALFAAKGIDDHFVRIPGRTRTGVKIVDEANQQTTDINMPGQAFTPDALERLMAVVDDLAATCDWFALAGNLPPDTPPTIYVTLIEQLKAHGKKMVLDTSREALRQGVRAGPTIVKPNIDELAQITGEALPDEAAVEAAARQLLTDYGIELVVISMGERGALFVDAETSLRAVPPSVTVKSTVGAGDAMVAGLIASQGEGLALAESARLATAFSVGTITRVGPHLPAVDTLRAYVEQVTVEPLATRADME